jgi:hypothetical protein
MEPKPNDPRIKELMQYLWKNIEYWDKHGNNQRDAIEGVIFSTLVMLDGESGIQPPDAEVMNCGHLHELFFGFKPEQ